MKTWKGTSKKRKRSQNEAVRLPIHQSSSGRVHLVLHKNTHGAVAAASLSGPLFAETWQNTLTASAANTAITKLGDTPTLEGVRQLAHEAMAALSQFIEGLVTKPDAPSVACAEGCAHCCHQSVGVTPAEAVAIVEHLQHTNTPSELMNVAARIHEARERAEGLSAQQRHSPQLPCPLLVNHRCSVYTVRPLSCRATNSLDAEQCRLNLNDAQARARYLQSGKGPDSLLAPYRASHALSAGLQMSLSEVYGLDMQPLDLSRALDELLRNPDLASVWQKTGRGLESARGGNASDNEHLLQLAGVTDIAQSEQ